MKHCADGDCPDLLRDRRHGEFRDEIAVCPACGSRLVAGPAPPTRPPVDWVDRIVVATFPTPVEAHLARASLEAAGIPAAVENEHLAGIQWLYASAIGGVRVTVAASEAEEAAAVLRAVGPASAPATVADARDEGDACPRCGADAGPPPRTRRRFRALSLLVGVPFSTSPGRRRCAACGHRWRVA